MELNVVPPFMSHVKDIETLNKLYSKINYPLNYQKVLGKKTTPWDSKDWDSVTLGNFRIDFQAIDTLYYVNVNEVNQEDRTYEMLCRTKYNGKNYFVEMYAYCDDKGFENNRGGGCLTITRFVSVFLRDIIALKHDHANINHIYCALIKDGYGYLDKHHDGLEDINVYLTKINTVTMFLEHQDPMEIEDMEFLE